MTRITQPTLHAEKCYIREAARKRSFRPLGLIRINEKAINNHTYPIMDISCS